MKKVGVEKASLDSCIQDAQHERVVVTRGGQPVALIVGLENLDEEQLQLSCSDEFWNLISQRREEKTMTRPELDQRLSGLE